VAKKIPQVPATAVAEQVERDLASAPLGQPCVHVGAGVDRGEDHFQRCPNIALVYQTGDTAEFPGRIPREARQRIEFILEQLRVDAALNEVLLDWQVSVHEPILLLYAKGNQPSVLLGEFLRL